MIRKIVCIILTILIVSVCFTGCAQLIDKGKRVEDMQQEEFSFIVVEHGPHYNIVYHVQTGVMYVMSGNNGYESFTLLVNEDGSPMIWKER